MLLLVVVLVMTVVKGPIRYPEYQIRLHDVSRLSPPAHQSDKGQLLVSVLAGRHKIPFDLLC